MAGQAGPPGDGSPRVRDDGSPRVREDGSTSSGLGMSPSTLTPTGDVQDGTGDVTVNRATSLRTEDSESFANSSDGFDVVGNASLLIDNDVGRELNTRGTSARARNPWNYENYLSYLTTGKVRERRAHQQEADEAEKSGELPMRATSSQATDSFPGESRQPGPPFSGRLSTRSDGCSASSKEGRPSEHGRRRSGTSACGSSGSGVVCMTHPLPPVVQGNHGSVASRARMESLAIPSDKSRGIATEKELISQLMVTGAGHGSANSIDEQHKTLARVLQAVFAGGEDNSGASPAQAADTGGRGGGKMNSEKSDTSSMSGADGVNRPLFSFCKWSCCVRLRGFARAATETHVWTSFFMTLTIYLLFGPDLAKVFGNKEHDYAFALVNTFVFFFFTFEVIFSAIGRPKYVCSVLFLLDMVALFSIFAETLLLASFDHIDDKSVYVSKMARSARMTRVARIARVARVTRLVPQLMRMCRGQQRELAKILLHRRLWRIFLFFDRDGDGVVSTFDFKCFYLTLLQECPNILKDDRFEILRNDVSFLCNLPAIMENKPLAWDDWRQMILGTGLGRGMEKIHELDVEQDEGVWSLTQKLSDSTALKVCIGIMTVVGALSLLQNFESDLSVLQGLAQLDATARAEHAAGPAGRDAVFLCDQIRLFASWHSVMFLYLDGSAYWLDGRCLLEGVPAAELDPLSHADQVIKESPLRRSDIIKACWPGGEDCEPGGTNSLVVVDAQTVQFAAIVSCATTFSLIALLIVFVIILNRGIAKFSKTMLQPLRAISDDMMALACTDLVHIDAETAEEAGRQIKVAEELHHLQTTFRNMRRAIRSWSKFVPPVVVQRLFTAGIEATIGVARCYATVLFVDVVDFEGICLGLPPQEVLDLLSTVLDKIATIIQRHRGTLLEFIGDEVLAVFNIPNTVRNHNCAAVAAAAEIHMAVMSLPLISHGGTSKKIRCRCGVHTANLLVGNLGSSRRIKYGVLGDGVNLTARLKGLNSRYKTHTLTSDAVAREEGFKRRFISRPVDLVAVKGKTAPTAVYEVMPTRGRDETKWIRAAFGRHDIAFRLYLDREFQDAASAFQDVEDIFKENGLEDEPSRLLRRRCLAYMEEPPPEEWDGVDRLTKKSFDPGGESPTAPPLTDAAPCQERRNTSPRVLAERNDLEDEEEHFVHSTPVSIIRDAPAEQAAVPVTRGPVQAATSDPELHEASMMDRLMCLCTMWGASGGAAAVASAPSRPELMSSI